jgi:uncharacterized Zn-binding protein involved in type VI secretion
MPAKARIPHGLRRGHHRADICCDHCSAGDFKMQKMLTVIFALIALPAIAQEQTGTPGVITQGSRDVMIGGHPAARQGDGTNNGDVIVEGSKDVFINGKPAVVSGSKTNCGGTIVAGHGVFINGKPAGSTGDLATACPGK